MDHINDGLSLLYDLVLRCHGRTFDDAQLQSAILLRIHASNSVLKRSPARKTGSRNGSMTRPNVVHFRSEDSRNSQQE